jgi:hypothetical protein
VPEPIVISFPAPLSTAEVVAPPASLPAAAPPNGGAKRASAQTAQAALDDARTRLEE